ncbi:MAG: helix-turn-helix transcriptional regulator [Lachnospiraceae bacterium]|nr:helix-turn-helix transcriptional regulator [Clostridiales bacterium]MCD8336958.1 helix-turn-helix transcriptional regulator [Lachnospiraceae bacterium]MCD8396020.1 helix-turn-helix transcriptional regulator [Lachnospiraceae bacterium]
MSVSYDKLWKMLIDKRMNRTELKDEAGVSFNVVAKLGKGETVSLDSLYKICKALNCDIGDIMEFTDDEAERQA